MMSLKRFGKNLKIGDKNLKIQEKLLIFKNYLINAKQNKIQMPKKESLSITEKSERVRVTKKPVVESKKKNTYLSILHRDSKKVEAVLENKENIQTVSKLPIGDNQSVNFMTMAKLDWDNNEIHAGIVKDVTAKGGYRYKIIEPILTKKEQHAFDLIKKLLMTELTVSINEINSKKEAERKLKRKISSLVKKYRLGIPKKNLEKIYYYAIRDFVHFGKIEALMRDNMVEEISCDGVNVPIYIWHREHESMPTNIIFEKESELNNYARKMAYVCGKHISLSQPIMDASLPGGSRINLTLGNEITKKGSTFTIRRFKADPITVIDLIKYRTISLDIASFMWYMIEKRATMLVAGGTASGKTTELNALATFIQPGQKVVSIEDTQELNLPHENWIPAVSRQSFSDKQRGEISQFDLLRAALRQRPDIIIVGETRGQEAYTLFQAMATGHGGFSSIHADSIEATLTRLTSAPMEVPPALIANSLDLILLQLKIRMGEKSVRRIIQVSEIESFDKRTGDIQFHDVFKWDPIKDEHNYLGNSVVFKRIRDRDGETLEKFEYELKKRRVALEWMVKNNIRDYREVSNNIMEFYEDPERYYDRKRLDL